MRTLTRLAAVGAALAAVASAAPAAHADSIAYIKDGNVWLSTPDGARRHQVTAGGAYADVSQADDGTMIALTGVRLHKLDRFGRVLADFDTPVSDTRPAGPAHVLRPVRSRHLAGRQQGRLHLLLDDAEPEPGLLSRPPASSPSARAARRTRGPTARRAGTSPASAGILAGATRSGSTTTPRC
jgi:hypothetical protein